MGYLSILLVCILVFSIFSSQHALRSNRLLQSKSHTLHQPSLLASIRVYKLYSTPSDGDKPEEVPQVASSSTNEVAEGDSQPEETPAERYRREKLEEINELKAKEVFVTRSTGRYECQACGYIYDEEKGYEKRGILPGTPFEELEKFRCPQCGASKKYFVPETETLSGFKENLKYGLGTNALTSGQKNLLIFGGLGLAFLVFMSGYLLE
jgi:rubredoxin